MPTDQRLIEDYIPIEAISEQAPREIHPQRPYLHPAPLAGARAARWVRRSARCIV